MQYAAPNTVEEASSLLAAAGSSGRVLAGGTDLLVQMRSGRIDPGVVVDIKKIEETRTIRVDGGKLIVGSAVSGAELADHPEAHSMWPGLVEATDLIGSTQIQGRASIGGNLCNASPAADSVPALIAARAVCNIAGPGGRRQCPVEEICTGPGKTSLAAGEFIVSFELPERAPRSGDAYLRFIPRTEMDIAVVGAGVNLTLNAEGVCTDARVALGAVAPTARLVPDAAAALIGTSLEEPAIEALCAAASAACKPIDDMRGTIEFRTDVAGVLAVRAARIAYERARNA